MRKYLVPAFSAVLFSAGSALAADLPSREPAIAPAPVAAPVQAYNWSGAYIGLSAGAARQSQRTVSPSGNFLLPVNVPFIPGMRVPTEKSRWGAALGATLGYNYQFGSMVLGVEGDVNYITSGSGKRTFVNTGFGLPAAIVPGVAPNALAYSRGRGTNFLGTARIRAGYAFDNVLLYATGGLAFRNASKQGNILVTDATPVTVANFVPGKQASNVGYAVGAGLEYAIDSNWSVKGEYMYHNFGKKNIVLTDAVNAPGFSYNSKSVNSIHVMRIGLNYHFFSSGAPAVARY
jgi:outer membrane immunogenic protein